MKKETIMKVINTQKEKVVKHLPMMASTVAFAGVIFTMALTAKATVKAVKIAEELDSDKPKDIAKATWKCYIPPMVAGVMTMSCIVAATTMNQKRFLSMAGLYSVTNDAFEDYKRKTKESIGEPKERKIRESILQEKLSKTDVPAEMLNVSDGLDLCFDEWSGRYFLNTQSNITQKVAEFNQRLVWETWLSLNELYLTLGLDWAECGDRVGWNVDKFCEVSFATKLAPNGKPCIVMEFLNSPTYEYPW